MRPRQWWKVLGMTVLTLAPATVAAASPITFGPTAWTAAPKGSNTHAAFFDNLSLDCTTCNIAFLLAKYDGVEYLNDGLGGPVGFGFAGYDKASPTLFASITAWTNGKLTWGSGSGLFHYDNGMGNGFNSIQRTAMVLFRQIQQDQTQYWLAIEDQPQTLPTYDGDFNDYVVTFTEPIPPIIPPPVIPPPVIPPPIIPPGPVPEPTSLLLVASGLVVAWTRRFSARRNGRAPSLPAGRS